MNDWGLYRRRQHHSQHPQLLAFWEKLAPWALDLVGFVGAYGFSHYLRMGYFAGHLLLSGHFLVLLLSMMLVFYVFDLYHTESQIAGLRPPGRALLAVLATALVWSLLIFLFGQNLYLGSYFGRGVLLLTCGIFAAWAALIRVQLAKIFRRRRAAMEWLAVGSWSEFANFYQEFRHCGKQGKIFFLLPESIPAGEIPLIGTWQDYERLAQENWDGLIVGESVKNHPTLLRSIMRSRLEGLRVYDLIDFYEQVWYKVAICSIQDHWVAMSKGFTLLHNRVGLRAKRVGDVCLALLFFLLTLPFFLIIPFLIKLHDGGPVLFRQRRTGAMGQEFTIYKFRSMRPNAEGPGQAQWAVAKDQRITPIGRFLRFFRLDELPQLWNVLRGDMSFIGPRPERPEFNKILEEQIPYYNLRHIVKPGITGWAQVFYRYGASLEDARIKLQYDLYYIKNYSLILDLAIILKTLRVVLMGEGR